MTEVIRTALDAGYDLLGYPQLVRLNPNIPYKTRGNAALAARFGHGLGRPTEVGRIREVSVPSYPKGRPLRAGESADLVERAWKTTLDCSRKDEPGTDPALVASRRRLPVRLYWEAVRDLVAIERVSGVLATEGADVRTAGSEQGLVGAAAAIAWSGAHPTWELLGYRAADQAQRPRKIDPGSVRRVESRYPELFLCTDRTTRRVLVVPHTPCPILFGLRATRPDRLPRAAGELRGELPERWIIYRTNQGSGDHLSRLDPERLGPYQSAILDGYVAGSPAVERGGHARLEIATRTGAVVSCIAFEPTKVLPKLVAQLAPGDRVRVWGGRGADATFRLEGLDLLWTIPRRAPAANPRCPVCGKRTSSLGFARGFRCKAGHVRFPPEHRGVELARTPPPIVGRYHPTPSARRHLHPRGPEGRRGTESPVRWWRNRPRIHKYG
jgi:tRNA(Ile2)-agmatinylcytidine synthase